MHYTLFIIKSALEDFARNKTRTFLTSLGILIGVASVVLLIAFGLGLKKYIQDQFESLGTNLIIVLPGKLFSNGKFRQSGGSVASTSFEEKDYLALKRIKSAQYVVPAYTKSVTASSDSTSELSDIFATSADIFPTRNLGIALGRAFDKSDVEKRNKVTVLGPKIADKLFGSKENAIGRIVKIDNQGFRVIGVLVSKGGGGFGGPDLDSYMYLPYKGAYSLNSDKKITALYIKAADKDIIPQVKIEMNEILLKNHKADDFSIVEQTEILNAVSSIFAIFNIVLVAIAAISLIVGGIGIMNIMYVSVIERIREIGIRRALGARKIDILLQFITEAIMLSVFGGLMGLLLSFFVVLLIQRFFPAYIDLQSVLVALGVSTVIGVTFGVFPAKKAADLSPIEAIRYE